MANPEPAKTGTGAVARREDVVSAMRNEMDRLFERFETGWPRWPLTPFSNAVAGEMRPDLDVHDSGTQITIEADLPGIDEKDVSVTVADGVLTIKGQRESGRKEKKADYYLSERSYGSFERALRLPETVDESKLEATFAKGVLTVTAPKRPEAVKAEKRIEIRKG